MADDLIQPVRSMHSKLPVRSVQPLHSVQAVRSVASVQSVQTVRLALAPDLEIDVA